MGDNRCFNVFFVFSSRPVCSFSLLLSEFIKCITEKLVSSLTSSVFCFILSISQGFDQLRIEGLLCDVTLVAGDGDEAFPVHRAMMASSSDYFKAMFTGERENKT